MKRPLLLLFLFTVSANFSRAQAGRTKIACIGNSVTYGYGLPDPAKDSYPALLQKKLGDGYLVGNFGHSGATLLKHGHNPYYKTEEFAQAIRFHADIAILHLGLNDTDPRDFPNYRDEFIPDYNWLIDTLRKINPKIKIYICKMTPIFTGHPRFMSSTFSWYQNIQTRIETVAAINHTGLIDLYEAFHNRPDLFTDAPTLHPNVEGAKNLASVIYKGITGNFGGLKVSDIFADNMVLQRGKPIVIWGTANAGTKVDASFHEQTKATLAAPDGKWKIEFPKMKATTTAQTLKIENQGEIATYRNILIGDVWLCSGQSNMYFSLAEAKGGDSVAGLADESDNVRLFKYKPYAETDNSIWDSAAMANANNLDFFSGCWKLNNKGAAREFSAVGYIFGKKIQQEENIPIGLIELAVGGSPLISWIDRITLESDPLFEPALHDWRHSDYIMGWCRERADKNLTNAASPYQRHSYDPCFNYEAGVAKLTQLPIAGVLWYQGESDAENAELYKKLFPVFIQDWRRRWKDNLPFYYVQLSSIERPSWNYFRDAQRRLLTKVPNTAMAVTSDLGDKENVHYTDKIPVGFRLANLALHYSYKKDGIVPNGPLVTSVKKVGHQIVISFSESTDLRTLDNKDLRGFELLDGNGNFRSANGHIKDNKVIINVADSDNIEKVAYGWQAFTRANLSNGAGMPASTFIMNVKK